MVTLAYSVGTAFVTIAPSFKGFQRDVSKGVTNPLATSGDVAGKKAGARFTEGFKSKLKVGATVGAALATAGAGKFLRESIREASTLGESMNAVEVTFGKNAEGIKKLGEDAATAVGLSNSQFNGLAVQFSSFAGTIAGKGGDVVGTMKDLTTRGADFASVMDMDVNEAMGLFQSGLAGETEPLRRFGIDLSAAAVESYALAEGIAKPGKEMTEQEKVQARYKLLMEQTSKTQGDFVGTSDSLANSQRILGARWDDIQAKVGGKLIPVLESLSGWVLNTGLPALEKFGDWFSDTIMPRLRTFGDFITGSVVPAIRDMGEWIKKNSDWLLPLVAGIGAAVAAIKIISAVTKVWAAMQILLNLAMTANPIGIVVVALAAMAAAAVVAYKKSDTFRSIVQTAWAKIQEAVRVAWAAMKPLFRAWWAYITEVLVPTIKGLWENVVKPTFSKVGDVIKGTWHNVIKPAFEGMRTGVGKIRSAFETAVDKIKSVWSGLKSAISGPVNFVIEWGWNKGLLKLIEMLPGDTPGWARPLSFVGGTSSPVRRQQTGGGRSAFASGGVLPGYSPGRDNMHFIDPRTGRRLSLSGGEAIMRPEFTRAIGGERGVRELNRRAMHGRLSRLSFFLGGVMPLEANQRTSRHGGYPWASWAGDLNGSRDTANPPAAVRAWKGGRVALVRRWNRSYGNHVVIDHGGQNSLYAHLSSIATAVGRLVGAGQMIGRVGSTGNSSGPHLHFEVRGGKVKAGDTGGGGGPAEGEWHDIVTKGPGMVKSIVGKLTSMSGGWGSIIKEFGKAIVNRAIGWVNGKIPNFGPIPNNPIPTFDSGGFLPPGLSTVYNGTRRPEPVLTDAQWKSLKGAGPGRTVPAVHLEHVHVTNLDELMRRQRAEQHRAAVLMGAY